jgi:hypothetical protein
MGKYVKMMSLLSSPGLDAKVLTAHPNQRSNSQAATRRTTTARSGEVGEVCIATRCVTLLQLNRRKGVRFVSAVCRPDSLRYPTLSTRLFQKSEHRTSNPHRKVCDLTAMSNSCFCLSRRGKRQIGQGEASSTPCVGGLFGAWVRAVSMQCTTTCIYLAEQRTPFEDC